MTHNSLFILFRRTNFFPCRPSFKVNSCSSNVRILPFRVDFLGSQVSTANRRSYVKRSFRAEITINTTALLFLGCSLASKPPASQLQAPLQEAVCLNTEIYLALCSTLHLNSPCSWY